jgi:hypothetical protein
VIERKRDEKDNEKRKETRYVRVCMHPRPPLRKQRRRRRPPRRRQLRPRALKQRWLRCREAQGARAPAWAPSWWCRWGTPRARRPCPPWRRRRRARRRPRRSQSGCARRAPSRSGRSRTHPGRGRRTRRPPRPPRGRRGAGRSGTTTTTLPFVGGAIELVPIVDQIEVDDDLLLFRQRRTKNLQVDEERHQGVCISRLHECMHGRLQNSCVRRNWWARER